MALTDDDILIERSVYAEVPPRQRILEALMSKDTTVSMDEDALENEMVLNMGPQHPATHGVLRILLRLDGETVVSAESELGYLHRGYEKLAENMTYHEYIPHTDRLDYISPVANNVAYVMAVEKLMGIELPKRAFVVTQFGEDHRLVELEALQYRARRVGACGMHHASSAIR